MADYQIVRTLKPEEIDDTPLDPIARLLAKIPGIGGFLSQVQRQTSPKGFFGPGIVAQTVGKVTGAKPQQVYDEGVGRLENYANVFGNLALPGASIPQRILGGAVVPMTESAIKGEGPAAGFTRGAIGAATQLPAELLFGAIKQPFMRAAANRADEAFERALGTHADQASASIMDDAKAIIPWWKDIPSDMGGLVSAVTGRGPQLLKDGYDTALEAVKTAGRGKLVEFPVKFAKKLGLALVDPAAGSPFTKADARGVILGRVDAADLAEAMTGLKDGLIYRSAAKALDDAGIGDPASRQAYKFGMGVIEYVEKTKAIDGGRVNTDALVKGMDSFKTQRILMRRGMGNSEEGLFQVARGAPEDPRLTGDIVATPLGSAHQRLSAGTAAGSAVAGVTGGGFGHYQPGGIMGMLAGATLPKEWVSKAPGTEPLVNLLGSLAQGTGATTRQIPMRLAEEVGLLPSDVPEADRREIEAKQAERLKALASEGIETDEGLTLDIDAEFEDE